MLYLDASVVLRRVLGEPHPLRELDQPTDWTTSLLTEVECLRSLDRLYQLGRLDADEVARTRAVVFDVLSASRVMPVDPAILRRASDPLPTPVGTLDAIHLVTALAIVGEWPDEPVTFATHDRELSRAARACGLDVIGA